MTKSTFGPLAGALVILAGLAYGPGTGSASAAKPTPHPTYPPVPVVVTVEDFDSDGNACRICDDGLGSYVNGFQGVLANIDAYGNIIVNFNASDTPTVRKLQFDYSQPVDPANMFRPPAARNSYLSTQTHPAGSLQVMTIGTAQCIHANFQFRDVDTPKTLYRSGFQNSVFDISQTAYLVVTRVNADVWEVEPKSTVGGCNDATATVARLMSNPTHGNGPTIDRGLYRLPFKMTLVRQ